MGAFDRGSSEDQGKPILCKLLAKRKFSDLPGGWDRHRARLYSDHTVNFRYDNSSLSHRRRHAFGRAGPHVADGKYTGATGLKW